MKTQKFIFSCIFYLAIIFTSFSQENKNSNPKFLTGLITDSNDMPVKGAYIFLDSLRTKVKTNKKGIYKIKLEKKVSLVTVFSINHGLVSVNYSGQPKMNFIFPKNNKIVKKKELADLGFKNPIRVKKDEITFDEKQSLSNFSNIYEMIDARVPGVSVSGESISVRRANTTSLAGSTEPLFLVNGTIVSTISNIAPMDVKSIKVLKGSEASFYGIRGSFGVIKITLKK